MSTKYSTRDEDLEESASKLTAATKGKSQSGNIFTQKTITTEKIQVVQIQDKYDNPKEEKLVNFYRKVLEEKEKLNKKQTDDVDVSPLQDASLKVEDNILSAENEVLFIRENAFFKTQQENELTNLLALQESKLRELKQLHYDLKKDGVLRRKTKAFRRRQFRERKIKDEKIQKQLQAKKVNDLAKKETAVKRSALVAYLAHTSSKHEKAMNKLTSKQARRLRDQQALNAYQLKELPLNEETRNEAVKDFEFKINHLKNSQKKDMDQLRQIHSKELFYIKAQGDLDLIATDALSNLLIVHGEERQEMEQKQKVQLAVEKLHINEIRDKIKDVRLDLKNDIEKRKVVYQNKVQVKELLDSHYKKTEKRYKKWETMLGREVPSEKYNVEAVPEEEFKPNPNLEYKLKSFRASLEKWENSLKNMQAKHKDDLATLDNKHEVDYKELEETFANRTKELDEKMTADFKEMTGDHNKEKNDLAATQKHELEVESLIRKTEEDALIERRFLTLILGSIADGVITMTPTGIMNRFNAAAEKMFGYPANWAIGKNVNVLVPQGERPQHNDYIYNYLSTGNKKVVGRGRMTFGQNRAGEQFPIHLTVSEVKGDGFHIFTGIITDMTESERIKAEIQAEEDRKKAATQKLLDELAVLTNQATKLLKQMLPGDFAERIMMGETPPPQSYKVSTIFFSDIVGFTSIAAKCGAMDIVNLLNDLYTLFDGVIDQHDVYKVETIGDAYMVSSGVPILNGDKHAMEIADMAMELLSGIYSTFTARHTGQKLQIRMGIHTGPCVAGVVGIKMPRYCLFGNTVTFASIMESSSSTMRIQVSDSTYQILKKTMQYTLVEREKVIYNGKIPVTTYWLADKEGFELPIPTLEEFAVVDHVKG